MANLSAIERAANSHYNGPENTASQRFVIRAEFRNDIWYACGKNWSGCRLTNYENQPTIIQ